MQALRPEREDVRLILTRDQYAAYRWRLRIAFLLRVLGASLIIVAWEDLDTIQKAVAIVVAIFVVPSLTSVKKLFVSYERFQRESAVREQT